MKVMKKLIFLLLRISSIPFLLRELLQRRRVTIILYHDISPDLFEHHLQQLTRKYSIVSLETYIASIKDGSLNNLPIKSLIITFDDGHQGNYLLNDIIKKYNIPVTIFLCSGIAGTSHHFWFKHLPNDVVQKIKKEPDINRLAILKKAGFEDAKEFEHRQALEKQEIYTLKQSGVNFQSHTITHPILPQCSDEKAYNEIALSKQTLETEYGFPVFALSYPNGNYSKRDAEYACQAGYECAITTHPGYNTKKTNRFKLNRICLTDHEDSNELIVRTSGLWNFIKRFLSIFLPEF